MPKVNTQNMLSLMHMVMCLKKSVQLSKIRESSNIDHDHDTLVVDFVQQ